MANKKKEYKLENFTIVGKGIWISQKELERLYKAYDTYKSDLSSLSIHDLITLIKKSNK